MIYLEQTFIKMILYFIEYGHDYEQSNDLSLADRNLVSFILFAFIHKFICSVYNTVFIIFRSNKGCSERYSNR